MKYLRNTIFLGILFTITISFAMKKMEKEERSFTSQFVHTSENDIAICNGLRKSIEPNLLEKLEEEPRKDIQKFNIEDSPHIYTLKLFTAALSIQDSEVLRSILAAFPLVFEAAILSDHNDLENIIHDLIKKRSLQPLQLLLSLPLYKSQDKWEKFYNRGISFAFDEDFYDAQKLFLNARFKC
jgi:hypothetical protein